MTPRELETLLRSLSTPELDPELDRRILDTARDRLPQSVGRRRAGLLSVCAALLITLGVIAVVSRPSVPGGASGAGASGRGQETVEDLVRSLTSDDAGVRDRASQALLKALREEPSLRKIALDRAARERDPEVRTRLEAAVRDAEQEDAARAKILPHAVLELDEAETFLHAAFSPGGTVAATLTHGSDTRLRLWSVKEAKALLSAPVIPSVFQEIAFTPDGERIAVTGADRIQFFDSRSLRPTHSIAPRLPAGWSIHRLAIHPEGKILAYTMSKALVSRETDPPCDVVLATIEGTEIRRVRGDVSAAHRLQWSPDGRLLVARSSKEMNRGIFLDGNTLERAAAFPYGVPLVEPMEFTLDASFLTEGNLVVSSSLFRLSVWSVSPLERRASVSGCFPYQVWTAGRTFATATGEGVSVGMFLPRRNEMRMIGSVGSAGPHAGALSPDGRWLLVTDEYQATKARLFRIQPD